jgi:Cell division septal protein
MSVVAERLRELPGAGVGRRLLRLLGYVALGMLLVAALGELRKVSPQLDPVVSVIQVRGTLRHLTPAAIAGAADIAPDSHWLDLNLEAVRRRVLTLPWVADAYVTRRWPDALRITVRERVPIARWGVDALLDRDGQVFRPSAPTLASPPLAALPQLHAPEGQGPEALAMWQQLAPALASTPLALASLTQDARGAWQARTAGGIELRFGDQPLKRLGELRGVVLRTLAPRLGSVAAIDLRYGNGFAVADRDAATDHKVSQKDAKS